MKLVISALAAALVAAPLAAQTAPAPMPVPAPAMTPAAEGKYTLDTPIETIVADPAGKAVLDKDLPGLTADARYEGFKSMTLNVIQPFSEGKITEAQLAAVKADLAAIK